MESDVKVDTDTFDTLLGFGGVFGWIVTVFMLERNAVARAFEPTQAFGAGMMSMVLLVLYALVFYWIHEQYYGYKQSIVESSIREHDKRLNEGKKKKG